MSTARCRQSDGQLSTTLLGLTRLATATTAVQQMSEQLTALEDRRPDDASRQQGDARRLHDAVATATLAATRRSYTAIRLANSQVASMRPRWPLVAPWHHADAIRTLAMTTVSPRTVTTTRSRPVTVHVASDHMPARYTVEGVNLGDNDPVTTDRRRCWCARRTSRLKPANRAVGQHR